MSDYTEWSAAGGPRECKHGYAEGIPCPACDETRLESDVTTIQPPVFADIELAHVGLSLLEAALRAHDESLRDGGVRGYSANQRRQKLVNLRDKLLAQAVEAIEKSL